LLKTFVSKNCSIINLKVGGGLEKASALIVIVHHVQVILDGGPLGNELHHLLHLVMRQVLGKEVEHEAVRGLEVEVLQVPGVNLSHQHRSGQIRNHHSGKSVDQTNHRETNQEHPPHPEDQEIFLVEDVVVEDAEIVASVNSTSGGTNVDVARNLSWEEFTHRVMTNIFSSGRVNVLLRPDVSEHFLSVAKELVEEESISDKHAEDDHEQVQELAEAKVEVISAKSGLELDEIVSNGLWVIVSNDALQHASLQHASPQRSWHLGESKAECEKEG